MPYTASATDVTNPDINTVKASTASSEFIAIKLYMRDVLLAGIAGRSPLANPTFTGIISGVDMNLSGALSVGTNLVVNNNATFAVSPLAPTPAFGDSSAKVATMAALASAALTTALPGVTNKRGFQLTNDGVSAFWGITPGGALSVINYLNY